MHKLYILFAFLGCMIALVFHIPLAWCANGVIQKYGFEKVDASGTLWEGHLWNLRDIGNVHIKLCLLYTSPSPRDKRQSRMPSSA